MNQPSNLETSMVRHLTNNEVMTIGELAQHCCKREYEIFAVLEKWEDAGYCQRISNDEYTLTR